MHSPLNRVVLLAAIWTLMPARADVVAYQQPPTTSGTVLQSSWWDPDGSDYDIYIWDAFSLATAQPITQIRWRGGFLYGGSYSGPVIKFTIEIYPSITGGSQPDVIHAPLVSYTVNGNAGQTLAGVFGGTTMYDYQYTLPAPFQASANTRYWVKLYAWHHGIPEWGFATASGGDGAYFRYVEGGPYYQAPPGDCAFTLMTSDAPSFNVNVSVDPAGAGSVIGAGAYPVNTTAALQATANGGWGFLNWLENGVQVSTANPYSFTVSADRTLVAHFVPAYTITTSAAPSLGGTTSGAGTFNSGQNVTVTATANPHFSFVNWTEAGNPVSTSASYSFTAAANRNLTANFAIESNGRIFDFDNAPPFTSLPLDVASGDLTAHLSATGSGFSIQYASTLGFTPAGFGGNCIYPNSVFAADLIISFSAPINSFSILYSPQELGCDDSATMRATGTLGGVFVATNTTTAPQPGTWPTGTLTLSTSGSMDQVVVHYDARPPTCQDYGVIFLADNMIVTRVSTPCVGDLNGDLVVDLSDLGALLSHYGVTSGATLADGDTDGDGDVDLSDLGVVLAAYGTGC